MLLVIRPNGEAVCLYDEALDLGALGSVAIKRASHVEPDASGQWLADLAPSGGPILGPFPLRSQALAAEAAWLQEHVLQASC